MTLFIVLKIIHLTCAVLSISGFLLRGFWMLTESPLLQARLTKILPHVIDTLLLVSAIWMTLIIEQYPFVNGWLTAKVVALVLYILLGTIALKRGRTKQVRMMALLGAFAVFFYIVVVAFAHHPLPV
jgi:uncharacterized membrane protein SirB2